MLVTFEKKLLTGFSLVLAILALLGILFVKNLFDYQKAVSLRTQTRQTIIALDRYQTHMADAETGQRGYLLTGNPSYLKPYIYALPQIPKDLAQFDKLAQTEPALKEKLPDLKRLTVQRLDKLKHTIQIYNLHGLSAAKPLIESDYGVGQTAQINRISTNLRQQLDVEVAQKDKRIAQSSMVAILVGGIGAASVIAVLIYLLLMINHEIYKRKNTEAFLRRSEAKFRAIFEANLIGVVFGNLSGQILNANDKFLNMVGLDKKDVLSGSITWREMSPPEYWPQSEESLKEIESQKVSKTLEKQLICHDGSKIDVLVGMACLSGASEGDIVAFVLDITDRKKLEAQLRIKESEALFYTVANSAPVLIWMADADGNCTFCNEVWLAFTGKPIEEELGWGWIQSLHPEDRETTKSIFLDALSHHMPFQVTYRLRRYDGMYRWMLSKGVPRYDSNGTMIGFIGSCLDFTEQKESEEALRESETRFVSTFEQAAVGIAHVDAKGHLLRLNQKFCQLVGYSHEELLHKTFQDITYPDDLQADLDLYHKLLAKKIENYTLEKRYIRRDGTIIWVNLTVSVVWGPHGEHQYSISVVEDITLRKEVEAKLHQSLKELSDMKFAMDESAIVAITDSQGIITYANDEFVNISKYSREEILGKTHRIINSGYHTREFFENLWRTITQGQVWKGEIRNKAKDGTYYWVNGTIVPFLDSAGKPYQYIAIRQNITAQKEAQEELHQLSKELELKVADRTKALAQSNLTLQHEIESKVAIERQLRDSLGREQLIRFLLSEISKTFDLEVILNASAREIGQFLGVDRCIIVHISNPLTKPNITMGGQYLRTPDIIPINMLEVPLYKIEQYGQVYRPEKGTYPDIFSIYNSAQDFPDFYVDYAQKFHIQSSIVATMQYHGQDYGHLVLHQCTHQRRWTDQEKSFLQSVAPQIAAAMYQAELFHREQGARRESERLRQMADTANQEKSQVLALVSHDLKNPLNAIINYSDMLESNLEGNLTQKQRKYAHNISISGQHMLDMVLNILDTARKEEGKFELSPQWIELDPIINEIKSVIQPQANAKHLTLHFKKESGLNRLWVDPLQFRQIAINLLSNAVKYNKESGKIIFTLFHSLDQQSIVLKVQDSGIGIPDNKIPTLFHPFYRLTDYQAKGEEGTGLGLSTVKKLVELHGGTISVESELGVGSVFTVIFPVKVVAPAQINV